MCFFVLMGRSDLGTDALWAIPHRGYSVNHVVACPSFEAVLFWHGHRDWDDFQGSTNTNIKMTAPSCRGLGRLACIPEDILS